MRLPSLERFPAAARVRGIPGSARALYLLRLARPILALCREPEEAGRLHRDLAFFAAALGVPPPVLLPARDRRLRAPRLEALVRIGAGDAAVVVTDREAARSPVVDAASLNASGVELRAGAEVDPAFLAELLAEMGYRRVTVVADAGEFALRQGRIDLFPAAAGHPVRVEHAAGRATLLRVFDVGTQRSYRDVPEVRLLPALEPGEGPTVFERLRDHLLITDGDLGLESGDFPTPAMVLEEHTPRLEQQEGLCVSGRREHPEVAQYLSPAGVVAPPEGDQTPSATHLTAPARAGILPADGFGLTVRERRRAGEGLAVIGPRLAAAAATHTVLVAAETLGEAERVRDILAEAGVSVPIARPADLGPHPGPLALVHGSLSAGFFDPEAGFLALASAELFGARPPSRPPLASRVGALIASLEELDPGDFVVHVDHGIGRFTGVERAHDQDFLRLEYAARGRLLVPVERIDLIRRYHGAAGSRPRLDTIGGTAWRATKARAKETAGEMAAALLRQAAEREAAAGIAFSPDDGRHREFADAFPYEPTPDQLAGYEQIRMAMERPRPMDWLLCGDVGYGKTEVAMRAAFKAAADGRQVAVLAPTTLLAEQHADVFAARFSPFPVRVDALTRFTPAAEERAALARLAVGQTGIVVGTHRLLAGDVRFADLGLVVVDEEQRFGVEQKERVRRLRAGVDVLALSATPIPRTLSLALAGVRGISTLETPPEERLAVKAIVARFGAPLVREALEREFARGGQAYFVHNRIESIGRVGLFLQRLLPGRRIGIAHARLPAAALDEVMHRFRAGEIDLLLATAVVGAGLDVPRANTLIVDRADRFGLADLYQLKGRVGRADRRAFAYFLVPHEDRVTEEAKARLEALAELSYLGAGFRLALRDLEIRGAGDLLGAEQSGHIAAVGFDLYLEMLAEAVAEIRGEAAPRPLEPALELRGAAHLPAAWIDDPTLRYSMLRKVAGARDEGAVADLRRELADRFGPPPPEAARLLDLAELRVLCSAAGVARLEEPADRRFRVMFAAGALPPEPVLGALAAKSGERVQPLPGAGFEVDCSKRSWGEILRTLRRLLGLASGGKR